MNDKKRISSGKHALIYTTINKQTQKAAKVLQFKIKNKINVNYIIRLALSYCVNLVKILFPIPDPTKVYNDQLIRLVAIQLFFLMIF